MTEYKVQRYVCRLVKDGCERVVSRKYLPNDDAAAALFEPMFRDIAHEEIWLATCNAANEVKGLICVGQGGLHGAALRPVDVFRPVIASGHGAFILAHNHPSGDPKPSQADLEMTRLLIEGSALLGLTVLDHIIWAGPRLWRSLRDELVFE
jgi:DNA repair protein RadC